ncbi:octopamine receptor 1 [Oncorhynchus tshawytscha]|uniref:octopamine receptor 1 n=1 Tax=Oncorhynchus tshawytscha TaxID=74940 RepID=UPI001C3E53E1|nr:octopamine receptor 1 [Oncorhynchus tshawytscha]
MEQLGGAWLDTSAPFPDEMRISVRNATSMAEARLNLSPRTKLVLEVLMVLMCLGAVTGNILVIVIVAATKTFHCVTSVLIMNLAISDLLVGVGVMPFIALSIMNNGWVDCTDLCLYVGYTSSVYCTASVLTLAAIALDRYHSIMDCLRYSSHCTLWRKCAVVLWIWLQALVTSCPPLLGWSTVSYMAPMYSCAVNWKSSPSYTAFMAALSFLMPAAVILFCYVIIVRVARSHARRIHNLEDQLQRNTGMPSSSFPTESTSERTSPRCLGAHGPSTSRLVYHLSGRFVSETHGEVGDEVPSGSDHTAGAPQTSNHPDSTSSSNAASRRLFSFLAQHAPHGHPHPPHQNSNSNHLHHHGVVRLFLVIAAFFLCWTPYIGVALVQATETALSCKSSLVPPSAVTFSYWLVLLNSDINPLLYALLSQRFQGALRCLKQKIRVRLGGNVVGSGGGETRGEGEEGRSSEPCDPCTLTSVHPRPQWPRPHPGLVCSGPGSNIHNPPVGGGLRRAYCSSVFTVDSNFSDSSRERVCGVFCPGSSASSSTSSCPLWQDSVGGGGERSSNRRLECLQVPTRTAEGSSLPFSAATRDRQATFFYGQITVRVEHDVC